MLRKLVRYQKFWEKNGLKYCHQIEGIKIAILPPEEYKHVRCVSTPTKNRERRWGFKTYADLEDFLIEYVYRETLYKKKKKMQKIIKELEELEQLMLKLAQKYYDDGDANWNFYHGQQQGYLKAIEILKNVKKSN